jgi:hypothetical protein
MDRRVRRAGIAVRCERSVSQAILWVRNADLRSVPVNRSSVLAASRSVQRHNCRSVLARSRQSGILCARRRDPVRQTAYPKRPVAERDPYQGAVEIRFAKAAGENRKVGHSFPPLLHAVTWETPVEPLCGHSEHPLLPTFTDWNRAGRGLRTYCVACVACLQLAPVSKQQDSPRSEYAAPPFVWRYRDGLNRFDVLERGVAFFLPGFAFFRPQHLGWGQVDVFAPEKYTQAGLGRDKGAGAKFGSTQAWRVSLRRPGQRSVALPTFVPSLYSEERAAAWAAAMNAALALPRRRAEQPDT